MSLDSEEKGGRGGVPRVFLCYGLVDAPIVLLSLEAVVLNVVNQFDEENSHEGVGQLEQHCTPAKKPVNDAQ
jgi:hypothetical protein